MSIAARPELGKFGSTPGVRIKWKGEAHHKPDGPSPYDTYTTTPYFPYFRRGCPLPDPFFVVRRHPGFPHPVLNALKQLFGTRQRALKSRRRRGSAATRGTMRCHDWHHGGNTGGRVGLGKPCTEVVSLARRI